MRFNSLAGPCTATHTGLPGDPSGEIELDVTLDERGRPRCTRLEIRPSEDVPITWELLRAIPVDRIARHAWAERGSLTRTDKRVGRVTKYVFLGAADRAARYEQLVDGERRPRRGAPIGDAFLERVATVYRDAVSNGNPAPTEAVAEAFAVARSTSARWVSLSRKQGILGAAKPGQAGEAG